MPGLSSDPKVPYFAYRRGISDPGSQDLGRKLLLMTAWSVMADRIFVMIKR